MALRIAAVTGANKGVGFAIVRQLALQYPKSAFNTGPLLIYLTARDQSRGEEALKKIHADEQLKKAGALKADGGLAEVRYHQLDISDKQSIDDFAEFLKKEHPPGIDIVVNNAGIAMDGFSEQHSILTTRPGGLTSS
jgi:carbonyl reductase 1